MTDIEGLFSAVPQTRGLPRHVADSIATSLIAGQFLDRAVRVVVVERNALFRRGLALALGPRSGIDVVGEAADTKEAMARVDADDPPDIILVDVTQDPAGVRYLRRQAPFSKIVVLGVEGDAADLALDLLKSGACAFVSKALGALEFAETLRAINQGTTVLPSSIAARLIVELEAYDGRGRTAPVPTMTGQEREVLSRVAAGRSCAEIAGDLYISENTAKNHLRNIVAKLHLSTEMFESARDVSVDRRHQPDDIA